MIINNYPVFRDNTNYLITKEGDTVYYDFFLSHCREDKLTAALPLYDALTRIGFSVWIDRREIVTGDKIFESIEAAIKNSTGVIALIASPYLGRTWTKKELQLTLKLEQEPTSDGSQLLPIYHRITSEQVTEVFPELQGRAYEELNTEGFDICQENCRAIFDRTILWFFSNTCCQNGSQSLSWLKYYQNYPHISQLLLLYEACKFSTSDLRTGLIEYTNVLRYLLAILSEYDQSDETKHRQTIAKNYCDDLAPRCFSFHTLITYDMLLVCKAMCVPLYNDLKTALDAVKDR